MPTGEQLKPTKAIWAAIIGFVAPAAVVITSAVTDRSDLGSVITTAEWITAACACVITSAAGGLTVYRVENKPKNS